MSNAYDYPRLRPVEVHPSSAQPGAIDFLDPAGIAPNGLTLSPLAAAVVIQMNGRRHRHDIQADFMRRNGRMLYSDEINAMIRQLDEAYFLHTPRFDAYLAEQTQAYRELPARKVRDPHTLGAPLEDLGEYLDRMMSLNGDATDAQPNGNVVGIVAPHLDYERGGPCYAAAYRDLARRTDATRFVILGTNHFGMSPAVVGTRKDFETPFGVVAHDGDLMRRLDERCGFDLCEHEFDHIREHSIELQVILLKQLLGDRPFTIAAYLCPDVCGPSGTRPAPRDGNPMAEEAEQPASHLGVDLRTFAMALREEIAADDVPTCIIAAADLSHVGRYFQDDRDLDADTLHALEASDRNAIERLIDDSPEAFRVCVADVANPTNICSVGCIFAAATALDGTATPRLLRYHQAVTREAENCVTCCAMEFVKSC